MVPGHGGKSSFCLRPELIELGFNVGIFHPRRIAADPHPEASGNEFMVKAGAEEI